MFNLRLLRAFAARADDWSGPCVRAQRYFWREMHKCSDWLVAWSWLADAFSEFWRLNQKHCDIQSTANNKQATISYLRKLSTYQSLTMVLKMIIGRKNDLHCFLRIGSSAFRKSSMNLILYPSSWPGIAGESARVYAVIWRETIFAGLCSCLAR